VYKALDGDEVSLRSGYYGFAYVPRPFILVTKSYVLSCIPMATNWSICTYIRASVMCSARKEESEPSQHSRLLLNLLDESGYGPTLDRSRIIGLHKYPQAVHLTGQA
jgi:hypothetical protein